MRREQFVNGEYYHILNRGVEGRDIFEDETDYKRFLEGLKEFNTTLRVKIRELRRQFTTQGGGESTTLGGVGGGGEKLVEIVCYCLMPSHFHLLLKQLQENGIQKFMNKLGGGYTNSFNLKYQHPGHLFQRPFQAVPITSDAQLLHISRYIHLNVLDLYEPKWRDGRVENWEKAKKNLENYPWSSYPVFIGRQRSDFCQPEIFGKMFSSPNEYEKFMRQWTEREIPQIKETALE